MGFLKGIKDELSHAVNEFVNNEEGDMDDSSYSASKEAEEEFRRRRNEAAVDTEDEQERMYDEMFLQNKSSGNDSGNSGSISSSGDKNDFMVNTIDGDMNMKLNKQRENDDGMHNQNYNDKNGSSVDTEMSFKALAGDIKDKLNEEKLDEMLNEGKVQPDSEGYDEEDNINSYSYNEEADSSNYEADSRDDGAANGQDELAIASDEVTEITKGTVIDGNIVTDGSANIYGRVKGNIACRGRLFVSGTILGASRAADITMNNAKISGDVTSDGNIKIGNGTVIIGNIYGTSAVIAGAIKGDVDIQGPIVIDGTAVVQGNIRSKSIQINNGAAIEGMISQSYAEVDYAALFDKSFEEAED